jgi:hypothetical protein
MRAYSSVVAIVVSGLILTVLFSCKKETLKTMPTLTASAVSVITQNSATAGGEVTTDGGETVTERGVCWSTTNTLPTIIDSKTSDGSGLGGFSSQITGLSPNTTYYIRAYATNAVGTAYYSQAAFKTLGLAATIATSPIISITSNSASGGGNITSIGSTSIIARGVCWNTSAGPTIANSKSTDGTGNGSFTSSLTSLAPGVTYYVRAYAINAAGTSYGDEVTFTTLPANANISTTAVTAATTNGATSGGNLTNDGGSPVTARGVCWSSTTGPTIANSKTTDGSGTGSYASALTALIPGTTYYVRAYATNAAGTAYGNELTFTTVAVPATLTTSDITVITTNSATSGGSITSTGGATVTARGLCWSTSENPTITDNKTVEGAGGGSFTSTLKGLTAATTYYVRAYATNSTGTAYGNVVSFVSASNYPTLTTSAITSITATSATSGGNITNDGGSPVTARGICWSVSANPTVSNSKTSNGTGTGIYPSSITGLTAGLTYHVRAYASNNAGTSYGNEVTFVASNLKIAPTSVATITTTSATIGGSITDDGGSPVTARGLCWSTLPNPTIADNKSTDGAGLGSFSSVLTGLAPGTTYYIRPYAINSIGTAYGPEQTFTTSAITASITSTSISAITSNSALSGGNITSTGGATITARGVCWSTSSSPTISNSKSSDGTGAGSFVSSITGLTVATVYYVRAYASNSAGTSYGNEISFTTSAVAPTLTTSSIASITTTTASSGGNISFDGGSSVLSRGICWSTSHDPTISSSKTTDGTGTGVFNSSLSALTPGTTYYVRAYATNGAGTGYGNEISFTTTNIYAVISTSAITAITSTSATSGGNITSDNGSAVTARGICWSTTENPTISNSKTTDGSGTGSFTSSLTGLSTGTTYYVRAYATNGAGTSYGNQEVFNTPEVLANVITNQISSITSASAAGGGSITAAGVNVSARGICWGTSPNPTISDSFTTDGSGPGSFASLLTGLTSGTMYYVRAYATNSAGTAYGNQVTFTASALLPVLTTTAITAITTSTAASGGNITASVGSTVTARGVCWGTNSNPTIYNNRTSDGSGLGSFTSSLTGLVAGATYYVRAYATNSAGTAYGNEVSFSIPAVLPTVSTNAIAGINSIAAVCGGNVTSSGGAFVTARGVCWSTTVNPTTANTKTTDGGGAGGFVSYITGLSPGTTYYVRAYATNSIGTVYGNSIAFSTSAVAATITTTVVSLITPNSASSGGNITSDGGTTVTARGVCWSANPNPNIGNSKTLDGSGPGSFTSSITGLNPGTTYYLRAYATNSVGTVYGNDVIFTTATVAPTLTTANASTIMASTANSGGNITSAGGATITARGVCWSTSQNPTIADSKTSNGSGSGPFVSNITGLAVETTYFLRAYATNNAGTSYGNQVTFTTSPKPVVSAGADQTNIAGALTNPGNNACQSWLRANLAGSTVPANYSISWSVISGLNGCFSSTSIRNPEFYGRQGESYRLRYTLTENTTGAQYSAEITVSFAPFRSVQITRTGGTDAGTSYTYTRANGTPSGLTPIAIGATVTVCAYQGLVTNSGRPFDAVSGITLVVVGDCTN